MSRRTRPPLAFLLARAPRLLLGLLVILAAPPAPPTAAAAAVALLQGRRGEPGGSLADDGGDGGDGDGEVDGGGESGPGYEGTDMHALALGIARDELARSSQAEAEAAVTSQSFYAAQQQLVAEMATEAAQAATEKDRATVPEAKAAVEKTRRFAIEARLHAEHAKQVLRLFKQIPEEAAEKALKAVRVAVRREAYGAAEEASRGLQGRVDRRYRERVEDSMASAMEPYHIALLRAQKGLVETEAKAQSAAKTGNRLQAKAEQLAESAQALQAEGLPVQAAQTMLMAHSTSEEGVNLRGWARKLFVQAEQLQGSVPVLQAQIQQAAASGAEGVGVEVVPELPTLQPPEDGDGGPGPAPAPA